MEQTDTHHDDYAVVRNIIEHISTNWRERPELDELARIAGLSPVALQRAFMRWAGLTPKAFLQAVTLDHARRLLDEGLPLLDASFELGMSSPARLHDLFVTHEAMSPGAYKARGAGLTIRYGYHPSPFGTALILATERGLAGISFADDDTAQTGRHDGERQVFDRALALDDMVRRWPNATYIEDGTATAPYAARVFDPSTWTADRPLRVVLIGTDFQIRVWEGLLSIPFGAGATYSGLATSIGEPKAARAVGAAVGRNPVSFVVPCHRVVGKGGALTGYHWGLTRKRAMLGWEAAHTGTVQ
ncbi:methylated-DNA--[protein]-cysteine S-methyltransferase [Rhizobiaceae bacterium]|nr:methylated-DNA--[protein]-cysteine S-methyltransferase [Rhizobiaceae bacterium]